MPSIKIQSDVLWQKEQRNRMGSPAPKAMKTWIAEIIDGDNRRIIGVFPSNTSYKTIESSVEAIFKCLCLKQEELLTLHFERNKKYNFELSMGYPSPSYCKTTIDGQVFSNNEQIYFGNKMGRHIYSRKVNGLRESDGEIHWEEIN